MKYHMTLSNILSVVSMPIKKYDITQLVENNTLGRKLQQHVTPNGNPHSLDEIAYYTKSISVGELLAWK